MADEFLEDSFFFRSSNVAALEAAIQEKKDDPRIQTNFQCENDGTFVTAKQLLISGGSRTLAVLKRSSHAFENNQSSENSAVLATFNSSTDVSKNRSEADKTIKKSQTSRRGKKNENVAIGGDEETSNIWGNSSPKSQASSKIKNRKLYQPLNITKNSVLQNKQPNCSAGDGFPNSYTVGLLEESSKDSSSLLSTQQKLKLDTWGLPQCILKQYAKKGITEMFPWQVECLCCPRVLNGGNLVYSAPTSAGKTLVSEIICIKTVLERRKKVLFVLPFVSVVREKMFYFQEIFRGSKVRVDGYMGGHSAAGGFRSLDLAVCTIEKANSLVNRLMEENELPNLGAVIVDELHLLGDPHRGYLLELLLTKIKYMSLRNNEISVQIVGMSATLPNLSLLSNWLDADLYKTLYRPVPLEELVKIGNTLYDRDLKPVRTITPEITIKNDIEDIVYLCLETIANGHSVLIFCATRAWCESLAQTVASEFRTIGCSRDVNAPDSLPFKLREQLDSDRIGECLEQLRSCPVGLDNLLGKVVSFGVAYHHAGLSMDERDIVEGCFKNGTLRVLVATTTLSSGVNLPARRVIVRSPVFQRRPIDILSYRQMIGRAGRMGVDSAGESIIICQKTEQRIVANLVCSDLKPIESCLGQGDLSASLKRAILEVIASGVASSPEDLKLYTNCTLLATSRGENETKSDPMSSCITFLKDNELIRLQTDEDGILRYSPTLLGQACLSASIHPDEGLCLFQELQRARQCFVLENELHLVYQVTPFNVAEQWNNLDWMQVLSMWEQLPPDMKRVGELVGVEDRFIVRAVRGTVNMKLEKQRQKLMIHKRFYTALALHDLVNEVPLNIVAMKFNCSRGMLQSLQQSAATYAGMVTSFCHRLSWSSVELIIDQFQDRLHFGTHRELLDILRLPSINGPRARALYNAGITCVSELTTADVLSVENALHSAIPFLSDKGRDGETTSEWERRRKLKGVWITGRQGLSEREAAELLIEEARSFVQRELGLVEVNWDQRKQDRSTKTKDDSLLGKEVTANEDSSSDCVVSESRPIQSDQSFHGETKAAVVNVNSKSLGDNAEESVGSIISKQTIPTVELVANTIGEENQSSIDTNQVVIAAVSFAEAIEMNISAQNKTDDLETTKMHENFRDVNGTESNTNSPINSSKNVSTGLLDNNICDVSNISETVENFLSLPTSKTETPNICTPSPGRTGKNLQNSMDKLFEFSFPNSALEKLDKNYAEELFQERNEHIQENGNLVKPADIHQTGVDSCLESWGMSISALDRLCVQEESNKKLTPKGQAKIKSTETLTSSRRSSSNIFTCSPSDSPPAMKNNQDNSVKESEDLFSSFLSPVCDRVLRPRNQNRSGSGSKCKPDMSSPQLLTDESKSPSLFSESFEINTGLMNVLDGVKDTKTPCIEKLPAVDVASVSNVINPATQSGDAKGIAETNNYGRLNPNMSANRKRRSEMHLKLCLGKATQGSLRGQESESAEDEAEPHCQERATSKSQRGINLHLGLSRRGFVKKSAVKESTLPKQHKSEVLTDSFLEAAFQTAFYSDSDLSSNSSLTAKREEPQNGEMSPLTEIVEKDKILFSNKKKLKMSESSDDEIFNSPQDSTNKKTLSKSQKTEISSKMTPKVRDKGNENEKQKVSSDQSVIGPPLTRRMMAKRQKSSIEAVTAGLEDGQKNSAKDCPIKKNPFSFTMTEDWSTYHIIDVCRNNVLFKTFAKEVLKTTVWAVSFACEQSQTSEPSVGIGSKILKIPKVSRQHSKSHVSELAYGSCNLVGASFCFGGADAYYLSLETKSEPPVVCFKDRLKLLRKILNRDDKQPIPIVCCFDVKEQFKMLFRCTGIQMHQLSVCDPKIGDWLLEPEGKEKTFQAMVLRYAEQAIRLADHAGHFRLGQSNPALDTDQEIPGRQRSSVEAILCYQMMSAQYGILQEAGLLSCFLDVEMPVVGCISRMELTGIGFNSDTMQILQEKLREEMSSLEKKAYLLAGRSFSLTSPADTARVIYQELRIGQGQSLKGRQRNTSKETLSKLRSEHPLPDIILMWRKLNAIHSKNVCPLLPTEPCTRLFGQYILHTATGRISMQEPNIQCIPRNFEISSVSRESFCMRAAFVASAGCMLVAADYSQLELRLLAHFSNDPKLKSILNGGQDVFCHLAATWNNISCEQVTDDLRQNAKQLCYGIIYGMGVRALADQLEVDESRAAILMETFHTAFPGINDFLSSTIDQCRKQGYVKTLLGRHRYLPRITSSNIHVKAHAERQALNTTVQGSAADLTKTAMIAVEKKIFEAFPQSMHSVRNQFSIQIPRLVLHLHDELMYEVPGNFVDQFCQILKHGMESAIPLSIKLPVKVKVGVSWGNLELRQFVN